MNRIWAGGVYDDPNTPDVDESRQWHGGVIKDNVTVAANGDVYIEVNGDYYNGDKRGVVEYAPYNTGKRTGGVVQSKRTYGPGSFEAVMKIPSVNGVCSSLWLYNNFDGHNYELDIELHGTLKNGSDGTFRKALCTSWITETDFNSEYVNVPNALNDGQFHKYRIDWHTGADPRVEYYIDDVLVCTQRQFVPTNEMYINIGCWFPRDWCGDPNFETDTMVIRSFAYSAFSGETAGKEYTEVLTANESAYHAFPSESTAPIGNLIAKFDATDYDGNAVWTVPSGATYNNGITFTGAISQTVELDCYGLEPALKLVGTGSAVVKIKYGSIVDGVTVTGEETFTYTGGEQTFTFTPPLNCTSFVVEIVSSGSVTLSSVTLSV